MRVSPNGKLSRYHLADEASAATPSRQLRVPERLPAGQRQLVEDARRSARHLIADRVQANRERAQGQTASARRSPPQHAPDDADASEKDHTSAIETALFVLRRRD
jgi:hypothetical protein